MKVKLLMLVCLLMAVLMAVGCAPGKAPPKAEVPAGYASLRMLGGSLGGKASTSVMALAAILNKYYPEIEWSSSSGSTITNTIYLTKGSIKLGWVLPSSYLEAYGFDKIAESRLRTISLPAAPSQYLFLIPEDKPWTDITQVPKGLTLCPGPSGGSTTPIAAEAWLKLAGLSKKDFNWVLLGKSEMADAWRGGKLDLAFSPITGPEAFLFDMWSSPRKPKIMGLSPEQVARAKAEQAFERIGFEAPAKSNLTELAPELFKYDVFCPQVPSFLGSQDDFPEGIAYKMAKVIDEHRAELIQIYGSMKYGTPQAHIQWARLPLDIHSGVARYYREKGYLK